MNQFDAAQLLDRLDPLIRAIGALQDMMGEQAQRGLQYMYKARDLEATLKERERYIIDLQAEKEGIEEKAEGAKLSDSWNARQGTKLRADVKLLKEQVDQQKGQLKQLRTDLARCETEKCNLLQAGYARR